MSLQEHEKEHEDIRLKIDAWVTRMSLTFDTITQTLARIEGTNLKTLEQAQETNGRVTKLEKDFDEFLDSDFEPFKQDTKKNLEIIGVIRRNKWLLAIAILAFAKVYESLTISMIVKWVTSIWP